MKYDFECIVIGAGIAGMTAAIYLKRAGVNVLVIDNDAPGGLLNKISTIENYPGYKSISGPELAYQIYEQTQNLKIEIRYGKVIQIDNHIIKTDKEEISAETIILATGRKARKLPQVEGYKNVSYCAVCDGNLYKDKVVAVVGGGNSALEEALYLSNLCKKVILIHRREQFIAEETLQQQVLAKENIEVQLNCVINTVTNQNQTITTIQTTQGDFEIQGLFISIGYEPNTNFLNGIQTDDGYVVVNSKMQTNVDYVFACGDSIKKEIYQLTTAVGEATIAATSIKKQLDN